MIEVRKGQAPEMLSREEFGLRFRAPYLDPMFDTEVEAIARLEEIAWQTYSDGRKSPITSKAGAQFADPDYGLSVEWLATKERLEKAQAPLPIIFGHHDLLPTNFMDDGKRLWLIDWEYGGFGTAMFDLANIASNNQFTEKASASCLKTILSTRLMKPCCVRFMP